jgi:hypothetical protein
VRGLLGTAGLLWLLAGGAAPATAATATDIGPWLTALNNAYAVVDLSTGDLDGDGREDTVVCYREDLSRTDQLSGVVIYSGKGPAARPVFHVQLEKALCEKVRINGRKLGILLAGNRQLVWTYGEEVRFRGDKGHFQAGAVAKSSSQLNSSHGAAKAFDNDLATSWAEGSDGTGIGEWVSLKLATPVDLGAVAVFCGHGDSERSYINNNRVHRGSIEAKTEADFGDTAAGIDFSALGISSIGDRIDFSCDNRPGVTYVRVNRRGVVQIQVRIESVFLGDKKDDTHIAEVELVPRLNPSETLDKSTPLKKPTTAAPIERRSLPEGPGSEVDVDAVTKALDADGRSIVPDDDF